MRTQKKKTDYLHIRIDKDLKKKYIKYCDKNGYLLSNKIRLFIEQELNNEK